MAAVGARRLRVLGYDAAYARDTGLSMSASKAVPGIEKPCPFDR